MKIFRITTLMLMLLSIQFLSAQKNEKYYFNKTLNLSFQETDNRLREVMKEQGFGVISEIDMDLKLKEKLSDVKLKPYRILGFCNPGYAYQTQGKLILFF